MQSKEGKETKLGEQALEPSAGGKVVKAGGTDRGTRRKEKTTKQMALGLLFELVAIAIAVWVLLSFFTNSNYEVYDENGSNPQTVKGVAFTVTSQEIRDGESKSVVLTNTYNRETVTLTANKRWASPSGSAISWPAGKTVVFELGTVDGAGIFTRLSDVSRVTLDNVKDANGSEPVSGRTVSGKVASNPIIICTNAKEVIIPSGVFGSSGFFTAAIPILLFVMLLLRNRRRG
ncbi:MAG: hypothetical protein Q4A32_02470 [Lachnospiraceae bacterium]|nr:hypothetical protein [Lachnospiraceae bacterium]